MQKIVDKEDMGGEIRELTLRRGGHILLRQGQSLQVPVHSDRGGEADRAYEKIQVPGGGKSVVYFPVYREKHRQGAVGAALLVAVQETEKRVFRQIDVLEIFSCAKDFRGRASPRGAVPYFHHGVEAVRYILHQIFCIHLPSPF